MSGQNTVGNFRVNRDRVASTLTATDSVNSNSFKMLRDVQTLTALEINSNDVAQVYTSFLNDIDLRITPGTQINSEIGVFIHNPLFTFDTNISVISADGTPTPSNVSVQNGVAIIVIPAPPSASSSYTLFVKIN